MSRPGMLIASILAVGLIGLGRSWQKRHGSVLRAMADRFDVRAVCDQVAHRAQQAAREFHARPVSGFRALVHSEDVDAILMGEFDPARNQGQCRQI